MTIYVLIFFCSIAAQSGGTDIDQLVQNLENNPAFQECPGSFSDCVRTLQRELQGGNGMCPSMRRYIVCAADACELSSDVENAMLDLMGASLKTAGIECDFGKSGDGNGQASIKQSSLDFILMALMVTLGMFTFRG
ncbi:hypothetical protein PoB_006886800 [Plakobranchus ocellatus]|uniref:Extracellular membrane protein CFEM domain-containing protein n=1 Tax=Plakobranchus ocellatus TaxID=259542 RepID=A0AAV4DDL5_9GAST|nr:hypothetical protein PoB_006886800 [Plakobranchus ocellatus]